MVRNILRVAHRHSGDECFPQWFSLAGIPEGYSYCTPVASEASRVVTVGSWTSVRDAIRPTPGASLPVSMAGQGGTSRSPVSVRDRSDREGKLWCKVCLQPHLEQGGTPPVERWHWSIFSLLQMGANNSSLIPLNCILKNWDRFDPQDLKKTLLVFLCDPAWPRYPLEDGERWPVGGSLKCNTVLQLDWFCRKQGKWVEECVALFLLVKYARLMS